MEKHGAQVVKITNDHKYDLDEEALKAVLMREDIQDLPVVVVSVAGAVGTGKSLLLNYFLKYLQASNSEQKDGSWLTLNTKPLQTFKCRFGSSKGVTTGIVLSPEPFVVTMPNGQKVAILLMDTEGLFNSTSTSQNISSMLALSMRLSSVQIYNLSTNINEPDLYQLQSFAGYGNLLSDDLVKNSKPYQKLEILVRDWMYSFEHPYGETGGAELLEERLKIRQELDVDQKKVREDIRASFENISCFLMPHPGFEVLKPDFNGIDGLSTEFRDQLNSLVNSLFSPERLLLKKINGNVVTVRDYFTYFNTYTTALNREK